MRVLNILIQFLLQLTEVNNADLQDSKLVVVGVAVAALRPYFRENQFRHYFTLTAEIASTFLLSKFTADPN